MKRRIKLTEKQYAELIESREWCRTQGMDGMVKWYGEELAFQARRGALPDGAVEYHQIEESPNRRGRWA